MVLSAKKKANRGFTLVELLVTIAIVGVLIGLLMPALQRVRESANRTKCTSNLKQIGVAILNFNSTYDYFPSAGFAPAYLSVPIDQTIGINNSPIFQSSMPIIATVGSLYTYEPIVVDPDGDTVTFTLETFPAGMTINASSGQVNWTPDAGGNYTVTIIAIDNRGASASQNATISVNSPPAFTSSPPTNANVGVLYSYNADATDPEGDAMVFSLQTSPGTMTINASTGQINWTPIGANVGTVPVIVKVTDSKGGIATQSFSIEVYAGANAPPTITNWNSKPLTANINYPYSFQFNASDPNGNAITFALVDPVIAGMTLSASGLLQWTPNSSQGSASHQVRLKVTDDSGDTATDTTNYIYNITVGGSAEIRGIIYFDEDGSGAMEAGETYLPSVYLKKNGSYALTSGGAYVMSSADLDGGTTFTIPNLTPGTYNITLYRSGYATTDPAGGTLAVTVGTEGQIVTGVPNGGTSDSGTMTGAFGDYYFYDTSKNWTLNQWANATVTITAGTGAGQVRTIPPIGWDITGSNQNDWAFVIPNWTTLPDATSQYTITPSNPIRLGMNTTTVFKKGKLAKFDMITSLLGQSPSGSSTSSTGSPPAPCNCSFYGNPNFDANGIPEEGARQSAGWAFQILPYVEGDRIKRLGSAGASVMLQTPNTLFFCPTRGKARFFAGYDSQMRAMIDYAASNSDGTGVIRSQYDFYRTNMKTPTVDTDIPTVSASRDRVRTIDIIDGAQNTLLAAEKRMNLTFLGKVSCDEGAGYCYGYNPGDEGKETIRSTDPMNGVLLANPPIERDFWDNDRCKRGAPKFGSSHRDVVVALFADGSVRNIRYNINRDVFKGLGTIAGNESVSYTD